MPTTANIQNMALYSQTGIDKIVRVFTGTFDIPGTCITRTYTYAGAPSNQYLYRIAHGMGRPVACDVQHGGDGVTWYDGGLPGVGGFTLNAFSDSTYVYIIAPFVLVASGLYYRVFCRWIDNYDTTNPTIDTISYANQPKQFDSRANFQKIYVADVSTFTGGTFGASQTNTITHNLGYTPNAKIWCESFTGEVWPPVAGGTSNSFVVDDFQDQFELSITTTTITITATKSSGIARRVWYKIYYDPN